MTDEEIIALFEKNGMRVELGAQFSAKGQIAQLLNGAKALIEECACIAETQKRGSDYQWVPGSFWGNMTKRIARQIREITHT